MDDLGKVRDYFVLRRRVFHNNFLVKSGISAVQFVNVSGEYMVFVIRLTKRVGAHVL